MRYGNWHYINCHQNHQTVFFFLLKPPSSCISPWHNLINSETRHKTSNGILNSIGSDRSSISASFFHELCLRLRNLDLDFCSIFLWSLEQGSRCFDQINALLQLGDCCALLHCLFTFEPAQNKRLCKSQTRSHRVEERWWQKLTSLRGV